MARWLRAALGFGLATVLAACTGAPPPPPPPTAVALTFSATPDANPSPAGQGAPVVLRVYQLAAATAFNSAEFFDLFNQDQATLKTDLVKRDDITLAPGQSKTLTLQPADQVKTIGIFAGYRDYQHATWRGSFDVAPHKTLTVTVLAGQGGIRISAPPSKPGS